MNNDDIANDYDHNIHSNPDHEAWADFFIKTWPNGCADRDTMAGWFANAMMAKTDSMTNEKPKQPTVTNNSALIARLEEQLRVAMEALQPFAMEAKDVPATVEDISLEYEYRGAQITEHCHLDGEDFEHAKHIFESSPYAFANLAPDLDNEQPLSDVEKLRAQRDELAEAASNLAYTAKRMWEDKTGFQYAEGDGGFTHPMIEAVINALANLDIEPEQPAVSDECSYCSGSGFEHYSDDPSVIGTGPCTACNGSGKDKTRLIKEAFNAPQPPAEQPEISELLRKLSDAIKTNWIEGRDDYNLGLTIATETLESQISVQRAITNHQRNE